MEQDYQVVLATDPSSLTSTVREFQKQGWVTAGGVAVAELHDDPEEGQTQWVQAMVKRTE